MLPRNIATVSHALPAVLTMDPFGIPTLLTIYSILYSCSTRPFIPISRNYGFDQTESVQRVEVARYTYKYIFYVLVRAYATRSYDISHINYVVADATARYESVQKWLSSSPLGTIVV